MATLFSMGARALALGFFVLGCSSSSSPAYVSEPDGGPAVTSEGGPGADAGSNTSTGESPGGELKIVSLSSTVATVTGGAPSEVESSSVTFIAIVTDKLGLDAIAGGQLVDDEGKTYAPFGAGANKGTFAATVDFKGMNSIRAIDFKGTKTARTFKAKFFDNAGHEATAALQVQLACRSETLGLVGACAGTCADVDRDGTHCGACNHACNAGQICSSSKCGPVRLTNRVTDCLSRSAMGPLTTCGSLCYIAGDVCATHGLWGFSKEDPNCSIMPPTGVGACSEVVATPFFACRCSEL